MRLIALEIPDDAADLAGWLEGHLTGLDLGMLVAELEAMHEHGQRFPALTLENILGSQRDAVLSQGLAVLPHDRLRQFLRYPWFLLELQELILTSDDQYWRRRAQHAPPDPRLTDAMERTWGWLEANVLGSTVASASASDRNGLRLGSSPSNVPTSPGRWRYVALSVVAAAATVLLAVFVQQSPLWNKERPDVAAGAFAAAAPAWGWSRPDALPQNLPPGAYLNHLADAAQDWFKKRPEDKAALARRIAEFRQGCSVLIQSGHRPLAATDRDWLVGKCRDWAAKLGTQLTALDAGKDPLEVRCRLTRPLTS